MTHLLSESNPTLTWGRRRNPFVIQIQSVTSKTERDKKKNNSTVLPQRAKLDAEEGDEDGDDFDFDESDEEGESGAAVILLRVSTKSSRLSGMSRPVNAAELNGMLGFYRESGGWTFTSLSCTANSIESSGRFKSTLQ